MKGSVVTLVVAGSLAVAAGGGPEELTPAQFAPRPGWHVGHDRVRACPGTPSSRCVQVESWAPTTRWRDCGNCVPPHRTLAALPRDGIAIHLTLSREGGTMLKRLFWPPRLRPRDVVGPIEGGPERIGFVGRFGRVGHSDAYLYVFFGRRRPTLAQVARANAELRSARLP
jgi:hypothetical protein